jgi:hypothetical protein
MTAIALTNPHRRRVNRTDLRDQQSRFLREASGNTIVEVSGKAGEAERCIVDKEYLDELLTKLKSMMETLEIIKDQQLFSQIMTASKTIDEDIRLGRLHSFEEAFGEE